MVSAVASPRKKKPFYRSLWGQVVIAFVLAVLFGYLFPASGVAMKPLGDAFIRLITMIITLLVFFTVVSGIAGMQDLRKVGRVGGKALLYFEVVSTVALAARPGGGQSDSDGCGIQCEPGYPECRGRDPVRRPGERTDGHQFLIHIIPTTVVDAFARGNMLQVILVSVLFGIALAALGAERASRWWLRSISSCASGVRRGEHHDEVRPDRRVWSDGVYGRPVRLAFTGPAGQAGRTYFGSLPFSLCWSCWARSAGRPVSALSSCSPTSRKRSSSCCP